MSPARRLTYAFLKLPYVIRMQIVGMVGAIEPGDERLDDITKHTLHFQRIVQSGRLEEFRRLVMDEVNEYRRGMKDVRDPTEAPPGRELVKEGVTQAGDLVWFGDQMKWDENPDEPGQACLGYFGVARVKE